MLNRTVRIVAFSGIMLTPLFAAAQTGPPLPGAGIEGRLSFTIKGGIETTVSGNVTEAGTGQLVGLPAEIGPRSYNDAFDPGFRFSIGAGYGYSRNIELLAAFSSASLSGEDIDIGMLGGAPLRALFADYHDWTLEGGARYHFNPDNPWHPYVGAIVGLRFLDDMPLRLTAPGLGVEIDHVDFYDSGAVFMFGADVGVEFAMSPYVAVGFESGIRWQASPGRAGGLDGTGLENINDMGSRIVLPLLGTVTFRFE